MSAIGISLVQCLPSSTNPSPVSAPLDVGLEIAMIPRSRPRRLVIYEKGLCLQSAYESLREHDYRQHGVWGWWV